MIKKDIYMREDMHGHAPENTDADLDIDNPGEKSSKRKRTTDSDR